MPKGIPGSRPPCSVEGCDKPHQAKGFCQKHYLRFKKGQKVDDAPLRKYMKSPKDGLCTRPNCSEAYYAKGECRRHYYITKRGKPELAVAKRGKYRYDEAGERWCTGCQDHHDVSEFNKSSGYSDGLEGSCREWQHWNRRWERYGLTQQDFEEILKSQGGVCAICGDPDPTHVDHDHTCCPPPVRSTCGRCVRGILCRQCNTTLGRLETEEWLEKAMNYIGGKKC